jgi:peptide deformylase
MKENDILVIDTEAWRKDIAPAQQFKTFEILKEGHPALTKKLPIFNFDSPPVDPIEFASALVETARLYDCIGLSANQCGFEHRVFVMGYGENYVAHFNPVLIQSSLKRIDMEEQCLSVPDTCISLNRSEIVVVEYQDYTGKLRSTTYSGITARCFQHELDHLNGILYNSVQK